MKLDAGKLFNTLAFLNVFDGVVTYIGLESDIIEESNPLMNHLYETGPLLFLVIKLSLSGFLYLILFMDKLPVRKSIHILAAIASVIYMVVCLFHIVWIALSFF